jgi:GT2 family glycosyltransferase
MIRLGVNNMLVSIIIPNYNGEEYLKKCLDSISDLKCKSTEIIIVDNNSTDKSLQIVEKYLPDIKIIKLKKNYGFSKAVNVGIKTSKGEYIVLLNNDTEVKPDWLSNLILYISSDEKIFSVSSKMIRYNEKDKIDDAGDNYTLIGWAYKRGDGFNISKYNKTVEVFSSCAGAAIYRKSIFEEIGYFDENFFAYMEDVDISYRARIHGYKNVYCSKAEVYHIGSATSGSKYNTFKVRLAARNNNYVVLKNMPFGQLVLNLPFLLIGWIIKYMFFCKLGYGKEYVEGFKESIKNYKIIGRTKYSNKNLFNYVSIELNMILNTFRYFLMKVFKVAI